VVHVHLDLVVADFPRQTEAVQIVECLTNVLRDLNHLVENHKVVGGAHVLCVVQEIGPFFPIRV
jgi:hypothetical protein